jgi:hypothetical protein
LTVIPFTDGYRKTYSWRHRLFSFSYYHLARSGDINMDQTSVKQTRALPGRRNTNPSLPRVETTG